MLEMSNDENGVEVETDAIAQLIYSSKTALLKLVASLVAPR